MAIINGSSRTDFLTGTDGDDIITGQGGHDVLNGGRGADRINGGEGHDALVGGEGNDILEGDVGHDSYFGGAGNDEIKADPVDVYADGGAGIDTLVFSLQGATRGVDFGVLNPGTTNLQGFHFSGFERLRFDAGRGDDRIVGGDYGDRVWGGEGDDVLLGLSGADSLFGSLGDDHLQGMHDNDHLVGGPGDDELIGGGGDDRLEGDAGADTARFGGHSSNYRFEVLGDGGLRVTDTRAPDPSRPGMQTDGVDTLYDIEQVSFSDRTTTIDEIKRSLRGPSPGADSAATTEDGPVGFNLLANDIDPDGAALSLVSVNTAGLKGTVTVGTDGNVTYTPGTEHQGLRAGERAIETFTYQVKDAGGITATGTAAVTVIGVNDAPVAAADRVSVGEDDGPVNLTARLLANDTDPDRGETPTVSAVQTTSALGASVRLSATGQVTYDPGQKFQHLGAGETATDTFTYTVRDPGGLLSTATATVTVQGAADGSPGVIVGHSVYENQSSINLLDYPTDHELYGLRILSLDLAGVKGSVALSPDGDSLIYTGDNWEHLGGDDLGFDDIGWTGVDYEGRTVSGVFRMEVGGVDDPHRSIDDQVGVGGGATTISWYSLLANDQDPDNDLRKTEISGIGSAGTAGQVSLDGPGRSITYRAPELDVGEVLTDSFTYTVGHGATASTATVRVTVTGGAAGSSAAVFTEEAWSAPAGVDGLSSGDPSGAVEPPVVTLEPGWDAWSGLVL